MLSAEPKWVIAREHMKAGKLPSSLAKNAMTTPTGKEEKMLK